MSRAFVGNFTRHVRTLTSHQLPLRTIRHRSYPSADEADIGKINVALNLYTQELVIRNMNQQHLKYY